MGGPWVGREEAGGQAQFTPGGAQVCREGRVFTPARAPHGPGVEPGEQAPRGTLSDYLSKPRVVMYSICSRNQ